MNQYMESETLMNRAHTDLSIKRFITNDYCLLSLAFAGTT